MPKLCVWDFKLFPCSMYSVLKIIKAKLISILNRSTEDFKSVFVSLVYLFVDPEINLFMLNVLFCLAIHV